jgi:hypothetical protein
MDETRRENIKIVVGVVIGFPLFIAVLLTSFFGLYVTVYSISGTLISKGILPWLMIAILLAWMFGPITVYASPWESEDFPDQPVTIVALLIFSGILTTTLVAITIPGAFWMLHPSAPPMVPLAGAVPVPVSPVFMGVSVGIGILCAVLLYGLGRLVRSREKNAYKSYEYPSRNKSYRPKLDIHPSPKSSTSTFVLPDWFQPAAAWGVAVTVGTFCGLLVSIYTTNRAVQLVLATVSAVATGIVAYKTLKK